MKFTKYIKEIIKTIGITRNFQEYLRLKGLTNDFEVELINKDSFKLLLKNTDKTVFENDRRYLKAFFNAHDLRINSIDNNIEIKVFEWIDGRLEDLKYTPIKLKPYELLLGYTYYGAITSNMEKYSHCLIGGGVGGGKSRLLMVILLNLINNGMVNLYLNQPIKSDLQLFRKVKCCKGYARTLEDTLKQLEEVMDILKYRERIIDKYMEEGIFNISDYNKRFNNSLFYTYIVFEEISLYSVTPKDTKEIKDIKRKIQAHLKEILSIGRYVGIFVLAVIQKATGKNLDTDIRDLFLTRVMFKCVDTSMSIAVLGYVEGKELTEVRECFILNNELTRAMTYYIDFDIMKNYIGYG